MDNKSIDNHLRKAFAKQLPQAPNNPWFTRKVLNRLPNKRKNWAAIIEYAGFALAAISLIAFWAATISAVLNCTFITVNDLATFAILTVLTIALLIGFMHSLIQRAKL